MFVCKQRFFVVVDPGRIIAFGEQCGRGALGDRTFRNHSNFTIAFWLFHTVFHTQNDMIVKLVIENKVFESLFFLNCQLYDCVVLGMKNWLKQQKDNRKVGMVSECLVSDRFLAWNGLFPRSNGVLPPAGPCGGAQSKRKTIFAPGGAVKYVSSREQAEAIVSELYPCVRQVSHTDALVFGMDLRQGSSDRVEIVAHTLSASISFRMSPCRRRRPSMEEINATSKKTDLYMYSIWPQNLLSLFFVPRSLPLFLSRLHTRTE